jgi:hypothetical protein
MSASGKVAAVVLGVMAIAVLLVALGGGNEDAAGIQESELLALKPTKKLPAKLNLKMWGKKIGHAIGIAVARAAHQKVKPNRAPILFHTKAPTFINGCKTKGCIPDTAVPTSRDMPKHVPSPPALSHTHFRNGVIQLPIPPVKMLPLKPAPLGIGEVCRPNVTQTCLCPYHKTGVQTCKGKFWTRCECDGSLCIPGQTQQCFCPGGKKTGSQTCAADGQMWQRCLCSSRDLEAQDIWKKGLSKGQLGTFDLGERQFNLDFQESPTHVIKRVCTTCKAEYRVVYYKRMTNKKNFNPYDYMRNNWRDTHNKLNKDFAIYSTLEDVERGRNAWKFCNFNDPGIGFPRDCGKSRKVGGQWNSWKPEWAGQQSVAFYIQMKKSPHPVWTPSPTTLSPSGYKSAVWLKMLSKGEYGTKDKGARKFNDVFKKSRTHIIKRMCGHCGPEHRVIYYRRLTHLSTFAPYDYMKNNWSHKNNLMNKDFALYSSYSDAVMDRSRWKACNFDDPGIGFPRDCGKTRLVGGNWNSWKRGGGKAVAFYIDIS